MDRWIEPAWKMFLSNKLLLAALWDKYPGHPNLVPTYAGHRGGMRNWVRKPLFGREGDGVEIYAPDYDVFIKPEDDDFFANAPKANSSTRSTSRHRATKALSIRSATLSSACGLSTDAR